MMRLVKVEGNNLFIYLFIEYISLLNIVKTIYKTLYTRKLFCLNYYNNLAQPEYNIFFKRGILM